MKKVRCVVEGKKLSNSARVMNYTIKSDEGPLEYMFISFDDDNPAMFDVGQEVIVTVQASVYDS